MLLRRTALGAVLTLPAALAPAAPLAAQEAKGAKPELVLPAAVDVVRLEVVVTEKRGRPRAGLRIEDFEVLEDGRPQPIVQFQAFARPPAEPADAAPGASAPPTAEQDGPDELLPARYVVLVIDDVHLELESLARVRKVLARFLDEDLRPEDQVALVTTSGARALSQEFTGDRDVLHALLSRLAPHGRMAERSDVPSISDYQAELIENGDFMALDAAIEEVLASGQYQDRGSAEQVSRRKARQVLAESAYDSRLTLETLEGLCRGLAGLTGRKALFLVSDGFLAGISGRSVGAYDVRRITDAATRAGVVVYALDAGGLRASPSVGSAASLRRPGPTTIGTIEAMRQRTEDATRQAMNALAVDTGGFLAEDSNDLRASLRQLLKDTETYYVIAYEPANTRRDGGFRRIEVRVPGVSGLRVRTRAGYFAPEDRLPLPAVAPEAEARRAEQRHAEMRAALTALAPLVAIPVRLRADFLSFDGLATQVVVSGSVEVSTLPFVRRPDRRQAAIETAALVYDEQGAAVASLPTERTAMDLTDADYSALLGRGLTYQHGVVLPPGRYQVRLAAREDATGLVGSAWCRVEVPDLATARLGMSGPFLLKDDGAPLAPGAAEPEPALRSVQARPFFDRTQSLYVQLYAYNARRDEAGAVDLVAQAQVLRRGEVLGTGAPEEMAAGEPTAPVAHLSRIRLARFAPGDYELRVTVTDRRAGAMVSRTVPFTVE